MKEKEYFLIEIHKNNLHLHFFYENEEGCWTQESSNNIEKSFLSKLSKLEDIEEFILQNIKWSYNYLKDFKPGNFTETKKRWGQIVVEILDEEKDTEILYQI